MPSSANPFLKRAVLVAGAAAALLAALAAAAAGGPIVDSGSERLYPLFNLWAHDYAAAHGGERVATAWTTGGAAVAQAIDGEAAIAASDAYLSDAQMAENPGMLNIPVAMSSLMVNYNVPSANDTHLQLSGPVIAAIYAGRIRYWNDKRIVAMNRGLSLPHRLIVPLRRSDASADTQLFTSYLSASTPWWAKRTGSGSVVRWPAVPGAIDAAGSDGLVTALEDNTYSIAYIGIHHEGQIEGAQLGEAALLNLGGNYVQPGVRNVQAAAAAGPKARSGARVNLVLARGAQSYPMVSYEYCIVRAKQPDAGRASELKALLAWAVSPQGGNAAQYLDRVGLLPLPVEVRQLALKQIDSIR